MKTSIRQSLNCKHDDLKSNSWNLRRVCIVSVFWSYVHLYEIGLDILNNENKPFWRKIQTSILIKEKFVICRLIFKANVCNKQWYWIKIFYDIPVDRSYEFSSTVLNRLTYAICFYAAFFRFFLKLLVIDTWNNCCVLHV